MTLARRSLDGMGDLAERLGRMAPPDIAAPLPLATAQGLLSPEALPPDPSRLAIVAVIDHAIPFAHHLLTTASGHSRVASIWMMGAPVMAPRPDIPFGQELRGVDIDRLRGAGTGTGSGAALDAEALYRRIGVLDPARASGRWLMRERSHGAAVTCTAAGFAPGDARGLSHPLIAVGLPDWALADTSGAAMPLLMQAAIIFIISRARILSRQMSRQLPLVVNVSLGVSAGPRDGSSPIERMQDAIAADPPPGLGPVHFVLASGNSCQQRLHALLGPGQGIGWQLLPDDRTPSEMQVWSAPLPAQSPPIALRLTLPDGRRIDTGFARPKPGQGQIARIRDPEGCELARLSLQARPGPQGVRQVLTLIVPPSRSDHAGPVLTAPGIWGIELLPASPGACEVLIQRDDRLSGFPRAGRQSRLVDPAYQPRQPDGSWPGADPPAPRAAIRRNGTCNAYAWGAGQVRVAAASALPRAGPPQPSSYCGRLADGAAGDLLAAGDRGPALPGIRTPGARGAATQAVSGTSIAAPQVTRWLAARLAAGAGIVGRDQVVAAARAESPAGAGPVQIDGDLPWNRP